MSSPHDGMLSSSPRSVKVDTDGSNWPYRSGSGHSDDARHSPTAMRRGITIMDEADALERQRRMDEDSAMQLSRARSMSVAQTGQRPSLSFQHSHPHSHPHGLALPHSHSTGSPHHEHDAMMSMLSPHEEEEVLRAQGAVQDAETEGGSVAGSSHHTDAHDLLMGSISRSRQSLPHIHPPLGNMNFVDDVAPDALYPPTMYVPPSNYAPSQYRAAQPGFGSSKFDFSHLEDFAKIEKQALGIDTRANTGDLSKRLAGLTNGDARHSSPPANGVTFEQANGNGDASAIESELIPGLQDVLSSTEPSSTFIRKRQRKLSQSNTANPRRQGKLALFESAPPPTDATNLPEGVGDIGVGAVPNHTGHDRPYRFSFYSNRMSATVHARSLSELPAEGQTFEQLFMGGGGDDGPDSGGATTTAGGTGSAGKATPMPASGPNMRPGGATPEGPSLVDEKRGKDDEDVNTWWLDVLSPTNEEMSMLSKVFNIHPLTTEDIQMEETREKIELFRNYYLVCFRGFDQDPYSPMHLEPLNMYIIVFREGIISFHFRGTPHPQNVRRRIKQLKDYISVTSDWISYALIDDITDAFGPLIQGIEYEVDSIDELVLILKDTDQSDMLRRIGTCRKKVMGLLRLMGNKADVVKGLAKRCNENWSVAPKSDIGLYLSDIQDHLITMTQNLNHYEKILSRSHSNYLAQISIEMTDANNQINDVLSKLTALGTVLIPMNLVTGLWGMNVHVPGEDTTEGYTWFLSIIGGLVGFGIIGSYLTYKLMRSP
ncbi:CorA-like magnesium transporter protein [Ceratobasidium sp. AG-Ba]|nr:CorA-like magnesium transporter protein [Ceratobasidium sp. AG-Ba]